MIPALVQSIEKVFTFRGNRTFIAIFATVFYYVLTCSNSHHWLPICLWFISIFLFYMCILLFLLDFQKWFHYLIQALFIQTSFIWQSHNILWF